MLMVPETDSTILIYVAYAPEDKKLWETLRSHTSVLPYSHSVQIIDARDFLQEQAHSYLAYAHLILLLLSPYFFKSSVCTREMESALVRHRSHSAWIIPIRLRPLAAWNTLPTSDLEVLPPNNRSLQTSKYPDKVCADIVNEIGKSIEMLQASALATSAPEAHLIDIPPDPSSIEPRPNAVEAIYASLIRSGASGVFLTGLSGIGKTKLAALVYHHVEQLRIYGNCMFADQSIWLEMNATTTLANIVDMLCRNLRRTLPGAWNLAPSLLALELFRLLNTLDFPRLIIFDQFEALLDARTGQVRNPHDGIAALLQLLAHHPCRCRFLLVSRFAPWGMPAYSPLHLQEVGAPSLETHEGVALLRLWGVQGWRNELEDAVKYCQGHVQAIVCLQAVLKLDSNVSLSAFFHDAAHRQRWIGEAARTFVEYSYMHQLSHEQRLLLRSFSIYRQPTPQSAVLDMLRMEDEVLGMYISPKRRAGLDLLLSLKLIYPKPVQCYAVPPVVAEAIRACFQQEDGLAFQQAHACAARYYIERAGDKNRTLKEQRTKIDDIWELVEAIWHLCQAQSYEQAFKLLQEEQIFTSLRRWGESTVLKEIYQQFLNWQEGRTATIYNALGEIAVIQGQAYEARQYFTHALSLYSSGSSGEEQVTLLSNLGAVYRKLGQLEEAQSQYQKALRICEEEAITAEARGVVLNNLGNLLYERGCKKQTAEQADDAEEYALAISYYEHALSLYQQANIADEAVRTLNNLGHIYSAWQRKAEAESYYRQALLLSQQIGAQWAQAVSLGNLGLLSREEANLGQAQVYYEQALRIFHQIGSSWEEATLLRNLGNLYLLRQRYDVALACFILARDIFIILQYPEHGKIPDWVKAELSLALNKINYEDWFQAIEQNPIALLEQIVYGGASTD